MNGQSVFGRPCHVIPCLIKMDGWSVFEVMPCCFKKNAMVRLSNSPWKVYLTSIIILLWIWKYPPHMAMQFCSKKIFFWSFKEIFLFSLNNLNSNIQLGV